MPFNEELPKWKPDNPDPTPTDEKLERGFSAGERPPASIFNWFFNRTYRALKTLFDNAIHKETLGKPNGPAVLDENGKLKPGQENAQTIKDASTEQKGIVQLSDATNSNSTILAATANAVKKVYDIAFAKYTKPSSGIPKTDLESNVRDSLGKADTAIQESQRNKPNGFFGIGPDGKPLPGIIPGVLETITEIDFSTNPAASVKTEGLENYRYLEVFVLDIEHNHTNTAIISFVFGALTYNDFMVTQISGTTLYNNQLNSDYRLGFSNPANGGKGFIKCFIENSEHLNTQGFTMAYTGSTNTSPGFTQTVARPSRYRLPSLTLTIGNGQMVGGKLIIKGVRR